MLWHHKRQILMDESRKLSGLPIRFKKEAVQEIPGTNKVRVVLPATNKRDSEILFGVDENYVERDKLQEELNKLEKIPEEKRIKSQQMRADELKKELSKPLKMYIYVPEVMKKGIKIHFEGEKTGAIDKETNKPVYDKPEDFIVKDAHMLRTAFGMGHYYSKAEREKTALSKESNQQNQSKGFMGRIVDKVVNHGIKNKKEER